MSDSLDRLLEALSGRYRIERELGRGGMATVYLAVDEHHDRSVALKVLHRDLSATLASERFSREVVDLTALLVRFALYQETMWVLPPGALAKLTPKDFDNDRGHWGSQARPYVFYSWAIRRAAGCWATARAWRSRRNSRTSPSARNFTSLALAL